MVRISRRVTWPAAVLVTALAAVALVSCGDGSREGALRAAPAVSADAGSGAHEPGVAGRGLGGAEQRGAGSEPQVGGGGGAVGAGAATPAPSSGAEE